MTNNKNARNNNNNTSTSKKVNDIEKRHIFTEGLDKRVIPIDKGNDPLQENSTQSNKTKK